MNSICDTKNVISNTINYAIWSLCVDSYRPPSEYEISTIATPLTTSNHYVIVKAHAASINPADIEFAGEAFKSTLTLR